MNETIRKAIFKNVSEEPFAKKFGLRLIEIQKGYAKVEMVFMPDMAEFVHHDIIHYGRGSQNQQPIEIEVSPAGATPPSAFEPLEK